MSLIHRVKAALNIPSQVQQQSAIVGPDVLLNIPGGTYTATLTADVWDAYGREWATSMSRLTAGGPFGIRVWQRENARSPWQQIIFRQDCHGTLYVIRDQLWFVWNLPNFRGSGRNQILTYRHTRPVTPKTASSDVVVGSDMYEA
jgi:hypothetical protein